MAHALLHRHVNVRGQDDHRDDAHDEHHDNENRHQGREHSIVNRALQHSRFGGLHWGSSFFGWLVAIGLATMLTALLAALGSAIALTTVDSITADTAATVGLVSGFLLILALAAAYYAGGYVAGRMARFDGARQGFGTWLIGLLVTLVVGSLGAAFGARFNLTQQVNLPSLPISQEGFTVGGIVTSIAILLVTLIAAIMGGKQGERYHHAVDAAGEVDTVTR